MTVRLVARPRLVELMNARWERRAVLVVAGPGFGKSVLLSQMMAENALAPRGTDVLVTASAADRSPTHFLRRIAAAAGLDRPPSNRAVSAGWLLAELARQWPLGVC